MGGAGVYYFRSLASTGFSASLGSRLSSGLDGSFEGGAGRRRIRAGDVGNTFGPAKDGRGGVRALRADSRG